MTLTSIFTVFHLLSWVHLSLHRSFIPLLCSCDLTPKKHGTKKGGWRSWWRSGFYHQNRRRECNNGAIPLTINSLQIKPPIHPHNCWLTGHFFQSLRHFSDLRKGKTPQHFKNGLKWGLEGTGWISVWVVVCLVELIGEGGCVCVCLGSLFFFCSNGFQMLKKDEENATRMLFLDFLRF